MTKNFQTFCRTMNLFHTTLKSKVSALSSSIHQPSRTTTRACVSLTHVIQTRNRQIFITTIKAVIKAPFFAKQYLSHNTEFDMCIGRESERFNRMISHRHSITSENGCQNHLLMFYRFIYSKKNYYYDTVSKVVNNKM